jgi:hypothetical protein
MDTFLRMYQNLSVDNFQTLKTVYNEDVRFNKEVKFAALEELP